MKKYFPKDNAQLSALVRDLDVDLALIDTSKVLDMSHIFSGCSRTTLDGIKDWELRQVQEAAYMFQDCKNLKSLPALVFKDLQDATGMFEGCSNLTSLDMKILKKPSEYSNRLRLASGMFKNCEKLKYINRLDLKHCENANEMFMGCLSLKHPRVRFSSDLYQLKDIHTNSSVVFDEALVRINFIYKASDKYSGKFLQNTFDRGIFDVTCEICDTKEMLSRYNKPNLTSQRSFIRFAKDVMPKDELYEKAKELIFQGGLISAKYLSTKLNIPFARANMILHHLEFKNFLDIKARKIFKKVKNLCISNDGVLNIIKADIYELVCSGDSAILEHIFYNDEYCDDFYKCVCECKKLQISSYDEFYKFNPSGVKAVLMCGDFMGDEYRKFASFYTKDSFRLPFRLFEYSRVKEFKMIVLKEI